MLDSVLEETRTLTATLGRSDTSKLGEYLDSVREVEQRIQNAESSLEESIELPDRPIGIPASFEEYAQLMFDLQVLAFRSDITRVFSLIMARELSGRSYSQIGVPGNHHLISHHREDATAQVAEGQDRHASHAPAQLLPGADARHAGRRRLAAGPQRDPVRQRHGRRQPAPPQSTCPS